MINKLFFIISKYRQLVLYCIIGTISASFDFLIFSSLIHFTSTNYLYANIVGVLVGITNSFIMNVIFNFKVRDKLIQRFIYFYSVGILGLLLSSILLYMLVAQLNMNTFISKILTIFVAFVIQYNLNKYISFKDNTKKL